MSGEFSIIQQCFAHLSQNLPAGDLGIGDDAAVLSVPAGYQLVVATDTLVQSVHFPKNTSAYDIAWKALAVNLSDLAAMGATPWCYSLSLSVPKSMASLEWFTQFSKGLSGLCEQLNLKLPLIGGDTTSAQEGALSVTVSAQGLVKKGQAILRRHAQVGDWIGVTGFLGQGALGLKFALQQQNTQDGDTEMLQAWQRQLDKEDVAMALAALNRPLPATAIGQAFGQACGDDASPLVSSAIDISDGLLQDLTHILRQSSVQHSTMSLCQVNEHKAGNTQCLDATVMKDSFLGAAINLSALPISNAMQVYIDQTQDWSRVLSGGDDYQLCFTAKPEHWPKIEKLAQCHQTRVSKIGEIVSGGMISLRSGSQSFHEFDWLSLEQNKKAIHNGMAPFGKGFQHF